MASSKRERELARQRAERQAARRAAAERKRKQRNAILAAVLAVLLLGGAATAAAVAFTGGEDTPDTLAAEPTPPAVTATPTPSPEPSAPADPSASPAAGACTYTAGDGEPARPAQLPPADPQGLDQPQVATIATDRGDVRIDLLGADAPCTVNSFRSLASQGYFADTPCHRLTTSGIFVLQCGDPTGTGRGGPGYTYADENLEGATYPRGTVAMANAGPGTNGSQFFLVYQDSQLPPSYTPFGTITAGLDVLDTVAAAGSAPAAAGGNTAPNLPVQIKSITVAPKG